MGALEEGRDQRPGEAPHGGRVQSTGPVSVTSAVQRGPRKDLLNRSHRSESRSLKSAHRTWRRSNSAHILQMSGRLKQLRQFDEHYFYWDLVKTHQKHQKTCLYKETVCNIHKNAQEAAQKKWTEIPSILRDTWSDSNNVQPWRVLQLFWNMNDETRLFVPCCLDTLVDLSQTLQVYGIHIHIYH